MTKIENFGRNVRFTPAEYLQPRSEAELLEQLNARAGARIRVVGSKHGWSDGIISDDVLLDLRHLRQIEVHRDAAGAWVTVGGGCQVKHLLAHLNRQGLTLPSVGLITEQTIAGATATGTHGSGRHSLSHYIQAARIACFPAADGHPGDQAMTAPGAATIIEVRDGDALRAARCSLGCLGAVVSVTLPCVAQYHVRERARPCAAIEEALSSEAEAPLQQFFLFPHLWRYFVQQREVVPGPRSWTAPLYRLYWFLAIDLALHLLVKLSAAVLRSRLAIRALYRYLVPSVIFPWWKVVDRSDRMLVMEHELFRHLELEAFVPQEHVVAAAKFVELVLKHAAGEAVEVPEETEEHLRAAQLWEPFCQLQGSFVHHYPVCFRRILPDDTLLSMAAGNQTWYAISLITYVEPREPFYRMAELLARGLLARFSGRIHWGKWFPLGTAEIEQMYPHLDRFRAVCRDFDPQGVFANRFTEKLNLAAQTPPEGDA